MRKIKFAVIALVIFAQHIASAREYICAPTKHNASLGIKIQVKNKNIQIDQIEYCDGCGNQKSKQH